MSANQPVFGDAVPGTSSPVRSPKNLLPKKPAAKLHLREYPARQDLDPTTVYSTAVTPASGVPRSCTVSPRPQPDEWRRLANAKASTCSATSKCAPRSCSTRSTPRAPFVRFIAIAHVLTVAGFTLILAGKAHPKRDLEFPPDVASRSLLRSAALRSRFARMRCSLHCGFLDRLDERSPDRQVHRSPHS